LYVKEKFFIFYVIFIFYFYTFLFVVVSLRHHAQKEGGADYETALQAVVALANFHGKFWNSNPDAFAKLSETFCPLADQDAYYKAIQGYVENSVNDFGELTNDDVELQKIATFCASNLSELVKLARKPPCTLIHGDARLSNYFFDQKNWRERSGCC